MVGLTPVIVGGEGRLGDRLPGAQRREALPGLTHRRPFSHDDAERPAAASHRGGTHLGASRPSSMGFGGRNRAFAAVPGDRCRAGELRAGPAGRARQRADVRQHRGRLRDARAVERRSERHRAVHAPGRQPRAQELGARLPEHELCALEACAIRVHGDHRQHALPLIEVGGAADHANQRGRPLEAGDGWRRGWRLRWSGRATPGALGLGIHGSSGTRRVGPRFWWLSRKPYATQRWASQVPEGGSEPSHPQASTCLPA